MIAKVIDRTEGRVVVAFEAETPAEAMIIGLVATDQPDQRVSLQTMSMNYGSDQKPPTLTLSVGSFSLKSVEMVQGAKKP